MSKISPEQMVLNAIDLLKYKSDSKGFCPAWPSDKIDGYSFNELFQKAFPHLDAKTFTKEMADRGEIVILPKRTRHGKPYVLICPAGTKTYEQVNREREEVEERKRARLGSALEKLGAV